MMISESKLRDLLDSLIKGRKNSQDRICGWCHAILSEHDYCHCTNDD